jgi:transposase-like protein
VNDGATISIHQFLKKFPNEITAREYLEKRRWNGNPICPHCGSMGKIYQGTRSGVASYRCCATCDGLFTVRTCTVFERSHVPLDKWLFAMYPLTMARKGISSLQLPKELSVTQKTAWLMLQRLREACNDQGDNDDGCKRSQRGIVETDETHIGGKESTKHESKKLKAGRGAVGVKHLNSTTAWATQSAVKGTVATNSILRTKKHAPYRDMPQYTHAVVNRSAKQYADGMAYKNGVECVWELLKRSFYSIYL